VQVFGWGWFVRYYRKELIVMGLIEAVVGKWIEYAILAAQQQ